MKKYISLACMLLSIASFMFGMDPRLDTEAGRSVMAAVATIIKTDNPDAANQLAEIIRLRTLAAEARRKNDELQRELIARKSALGLRARIASLDARKGEIEHQMAQTIYQGGYSTAGHDPQEAAITQRWKTAARKDLERRAIDLTQ